MVDYKRSFPPLENRFILAVRPRYLNETEGDYLLSKKIYGTYLVLEEYQDKVLCVQLSYFNKNKDRNVSLKINKNIYPFYKVSKHDIKVDGNLYFINKDDIEKISDEVINKKDYLKVIYAFNKNSMLSLSDDDEKLARDKLAQMYSYSVVRKGAIIQSRKEVNDGVFNNYYVNNILEDNVLELIPFRYDPKIGLYFENLDKVYVNMSDIFLASCYYSDESYLRISKMVKEKELKLKK